jgi:hypothetical protein
MLALAVGMALAVEGGMTSLDALHLAAPSLKRRRTRSHTVVVENRRRLAMRTPSQEQAAVADPMLATAEVFYDENLTVETEATSPTRMKLIGVVVFGVSCGVALASLVVA